jgi:predicted deacetylase
VNALVSIHDLMPQTFDRVERILDWLKARDVPPVTLLVVPGRPWTPGQIGRLRELATSGHPLAAHGWHHETRPRRLYHRLHAAIFSRNVAEHLDLDSPEIRQLMQRSHDWFGENDLPPPACYVPPAWALGPLSNADLTQLPYRLIETTRGLIHLESNAPLVASQSNGSLPRSEEGAPLTKRTCTFQKLPLTGYEADTRPREAFLRRWNAAQLHTATRRHLPLRISIHPGDLNLRLQDQLERHILAANAFLPYYRTN